MSRCATCAIPGYCCRSIRLYGRDGEVRVREGEDPGAVLKRITYESLPFKPRSRVETYAPRLMPDWDGPVIGETVSTWEFSCPKLGQDGRCTDYSNRPHACRSFVPEKQIECLHFEGAEGWASNLERELLTRVDRQSAGART